MKRRIGILTLVLALAVTAWCDHSRLQDDNDRLRSELGEIEYARRWVWCPKCGASGYLDDLMLEQADAR